MIAVNDKERSIILLAPISLEHYTKRELKDLKQTIESLKLKKLIKICFEELQPHLYHDILRLTKRGQKLQKELKAQKEKLRGQKEEPETCAYCGEGWTYGTCECTDHCRD